MIQVLWDVDIVSLGDEFRTFRRVIFRSFSKSSTPKLLLILKMKAICCFETSVV